ncbi:MAG: hypothetical protein ACKVW3_11575 [Phycisphaerales bacterium]
MSALTRHPTTPLGVANWQADVAQLLDEHHLAAISPSGARRMHFAVSLGQFLQGLRDAEVCTLYGRFITDLDSFCYQLERAIAGPAIERRVDGPRGVTALLRSREVYRGRPASKFRFYVWHDADVLLGHDEPLFGRLVDAIAGVAAEAEYASDDLLMIHRLVSVGSEGLEVYSRKPDGQFQAWHADGLGEPFWKVVTGIETPKVMTYRIDQLAR